MKKIMLLCSAGMSTSLMVTKMMDAAKKQGLEVEIYAIPEVEMKNRMDDVDVVLLAPQVRFLLNRIKEKLEVKGIPVAVINSIHYGTMNGAAVIQQAMELIG